MSFWSRLAKIALPVAGIAAAPFTGGSSLWGTIASMAGPAASAIGGATSAAANNRGARGEALLSEEDRRAARERLRQTDDQTAVSAGQLNRQQLDDFYNQSRLREQEGREGRRSAMRDLQVANYVGNRGANAPVTTTSGRTLNTMGLGGRASTDQERQGMQAAAREIMTRLEGGNPLPAPERQPTFQVPSAGRPRLYDEQFSLPSNVMNPSIWERIGNIAGPALGMIGQFGQRGSGPRADFDPTEYGAE